MKFCPEEKFSRRDCGSCCTCAGVCTSHAIEMCNGYPIFNSRLCIGCGHCGVFCPENAFGMEPLPGNAATEQQYRSLLETRRSIRFYSDIVPSEGEISTLISVISQSPTGMNLQGITVRVVQGSDAVGRLVKPVRKMLKILSFTGLLHIIGKITGMSDHIGRLRGGEDMIFRGAPVVLFFHVPRKNVTGYTDGVIAATAVMYHAVSMGMGTLWNGVAEKLYPFTGAWHTPRTRGTKLTAVLCVGYTDLEPKWKAPARNYNIL
ncbi:MAG: nitroreductase family protein [Candidatus Aegiribacteria sp.]|nr:nitroreductase family protein [Candidatus Aegiribacteria sp.]